jgi:hypothetical protein
LEECENCLVGFNLWAIPTCALQIGELSLDSQLFSNPHARHFVINFLGMLQAFEEKCVDIVIIEHF